MRQNVILEQTKKTSEKMSLSKNESANFISILSNTHPFLEYELNLGNQMHYEFIRQNLIRIGESPVSSPHTFALLEKAHKDSLLKTGIEPAYENGCRNGKVCADLVPLTRIASFIQNSNKYSSSAYSTYPYGTMKSILVQNIISIKNNTINAIKSQVTTQYILGDKVRDFFNTDLPPGDEAISLTIVIVFPEGIPARAFTTYKKLKIKPDSALVQSNGEIPLTGTTPASIVNQLDPVIKMPGHTNIKVSMGARVQADDDYSVKEGVDVAKYFAFPIRGDFTFPSSIKIYPDGYAHGQLIIALQYPSGGARILSEVPSQHAAGDSLTGFTVSANKISWDSTVAKFLHDAATPNNGVNVDFCFELCVDLATAGETGYGNFLSDITADDPDQGCWKVPKLDLYWGCLVEDTKILMADGSSKAVQDFIGDCTEKVLTGNGEIRTVIATTTGTEIFPCINLTDENNNQLMLTKDHPVVTLNKGVILAKYLKCGDILQNKMGNSKIIEVGEKQYDGKIWNLEIGSLEEAARNETTLFADGFLVGDYSMQQFYCQQDIARRREKPLDELPSEWHDDYKNFVVEANK